MPGKEQQEREWRLASARMPFEPEFRLVLLPARSSTAGLSRSQDLDYAVIPGRGQRTIMLSRVILCCMI
ncbi:hypothetical protein X744_03630 [Mesorhizobium sp. LNJC372A00]|nr:hypothetical protein X773_03650 [Mesorhizobium sp. LSJC285A00]ESW89756.1 hypothetical protein X770_12865 [Mesorhizobium sp. LSJC269B00]ESX11790.1 hypothetical protein X768_09595 [Mesorhizobium sp. LSJC265A00]ESX19522.1 hypothetical protein X766_10955 [Mesorhizobium sp. LSJC255A00]ESX32943.1 hypothetical protein X765_07145 [Mesorhizobium sp. LSHC440B00]ESX39991.1 hypothetical protein X763_01290 [Mesorhizobium sp. LSHC432A00]ESX44878.1 hypothetical protein X764_00295 [Mesorhizobium sp. LSHC4